MTNKEKSPIRGMNVLYLSLEQAVDVMNDSEVQETVRQLGSDHRRLIKRSAAMIGLRDRNRVIDTLANLQADNTEHEDTIQGFLNYASMKQESLFRLRDAARIIDVEDIND